MAAIVDTDVSINAAGDIRWTGEKEDNRHSILEFIQFLMDKQDDAQASGDILLDITVDTPFNRSTDQILTLNAPFNMDNTFGLHLYDGSVTQAGGDDEFSGLGVIGPVETGTDYMILQGGKVLPSFWSTGINPEASPSLVFSRHLVKSREGGADIDGARITVLARELGDQFRRFPVQLGTGNAVAAIANGSDIFNTNPDTTIAGWTTIINTEGFQELDIDKTGASGQEYYSQYEIGSQVVNDVYERTKWISQRSHQTDITGGTATGTDFVVENGTIDGQAQSFIPLTGTELLTEARAQVKILAEDTTGLTGTMYAELYDSDDAASQLAEPTGALLARSEDILVSHFTGTYEDTVFRFNRFNPASGADQIDGLQLTNAEYFIVFRHDAGDATNNLSVEGAATDQDSTMNQADSTAATWTASATDDIQLEVKSSPIIHGLPGEVFQGLNIEVGYDNESGAGVLETEATNDELAIWGTRLTYGSLSGTFRVGEYVAIYATGTTTSPKSGGQVLSDDGVDMVIALENPLASVIITGDDIIAVTSGATADITVIDATADESFSGGSGYILAKDDNGATGEIYLQVISGVNPVDNNVVRSTSGAPLTAFVDATSTLNTRTVNPEYLGVSTGSNIIGAYGIGFDVDDVGASDRFTDLSNTPRTPPNNVLFTVSGAVAGQDRILVGPRTGILLDRGQWVVAAGQDLNDGIVGTPEVQVTVDDGTDTVPFVTAEINWPDTGIGADVSRLRIERDAGHYLRVPYDSHDGVSVFTFGTPDTGLTNIAVEGTGAHFERPAGSFLTDGFEPGCVFTASGFASGTNSSQYVALTVTATRIVPTDATGMVDEVVGADEQLASDGWEFANGQGSTDFNLATAGNDVFLAFIDVLAAATTVSFTGVHDTTDRDMFVRGRDGGGTPIKTFESATAQFKSVAQTIAMVRTPDV